MAIDDVTLNNITEAVFDALVKYQDIITECGGFILDKTDLSPWRDAVRAVHNETGLTGVSLLAESVEKGKQLIKMGCLNDPDFKQANDALASEVEFISSNPELFTEKTWQLAEEIKAVVDGLLIPTSDLQQIASDISGFSDFVEEDIQAVHQQIASGETYHSGACCNSCALDKPCETGCNHAH